MIFTSVYGFNNMPRSFYLMGYGAIPFFLLSAVVFFVPFAFMVAEYGSVFKDEKGGIFSWMQICVGKKYAFVATFMWYTSYVLYAEHYEKRNSGFFGRGISMNKFTGVRGKSGSNDANAEYIAVLRKIFDDANVAYQFDELGKVDAGGGGTIAYIMANYGMEVIDSGIALLCMHAPYEVSSKADIYEAVKGYRAFLANA